MTREPVPINSVVEVNYSIEQVKGCIEYLLRAYPEDFIVGKNGVCKELGSYVFSRPKGVSTPTLRISLSVVDPEKTRIDITCSSSCFTVTSSELQTAITEVQNILMARLKGISGQRLKDIIKQNDSGNNAWGCLKSIGCLGCLGIPTLIALVIFGLAVIMFLLSLITI